MSELETLSATITKNGWALSNNVVLALILGVLFSVPLKNRLKTILANNPMKVEFVETFEL